MAQGSDREQHDPGDEDDGLDGHRAAMFSDPEHTLDACRRKFSTLRPFRVSPGEMVTVRTPVQRDGQ